jgi:hypothetical protein
LHRLRLLQSMRFLPPERAGGSDQPFQIMRGGCTETVRDRAAGIPDALTQPLGCRRIKVNGRHPFQIGEEA